MSSGNNFAVITKEIRRASLGFRILLVVALVWAALRLLMQFYVFLVPTSDQVGVDLQVYLTAAQNFTHQVDLYPGQSLEDLEYQFPYPPIFAFLFIPFTHLPETVSLVLHTLLRILAFALIFVRWRIIFQTYKLEKASRALVLTLPAWLVYSSFWADLGYLNIYTIMALLGTLLIEAVLKEDLPRSTLWLTLILITKPQWAFAAALPLLLARYRFFFKLIFWSLVGYLALALVTALAGGPAYVWAQYQAYLHLLGRLGSEFPWRGPEAGFLGYNHSIKQIFAYLLGPSAATLRLATLAKLLLLAPLAVIFLHRLVRPLRHPADQMPAALELALLAYLGTFLWLDILWEAFLLIVVYAYLLGSSRGTAGKVLLHVVFAPYALTDVWVVLIYLAGSPLINDAYPEWDYNMYLPITMLVLLVFAAIFVVRLWPWRRLPRLPQPTAPVTSWRKK